MSARRYDAIVVRARCAGVPDAMFLARRGYEVLLVDRANFPSDTISTHLVHPPGVAALRRWGLLDRVVATGCPPIHTYVFDFGPFTLTGAPGTEVDPFAYAPRRTVLDEILVDAAGKSDAEVRQGFTVDEILREDGRVVGIRGHGPEGRSVIERARVVVGDRRPPIARRADRRGGTVPREAAALGRVLHVLERVTHGRALRELDLAGLGHGGMAHE
jgi:2-polyprenyl-6-methoxyphenol hydroxylase-like FAD-dependent oxidoreductase